MRQRAILGAVLLIGVGVALGATVFRADIAQATGLAQSVTIDNTDANPVPVHEQGTADVLDAAARHAASGRAVFSVAANSPSDNALAYTVPSDKRLVIEYVSAHVDAESAGVPLVDCGPQHAGASAHLPLINAGQSFLGGDRWVGSESVRIYVSPGDGVVCSAQRSAGSSGQFVVDANFSGYLVNAP